MLTKKQSGWYGNSLGHAQAGSSGGKKTASLYGETFFSKIGKKGGKVSPGNFKNNPLRAKEAGRRGGKAQAQKGAKAKSK